MKKKLLSLMLTLALCLSLSTPAFAAAPYTYEDDWIKITNVLEREQKETTYFCIAPVSITLGNMHKDQWTVTVCDDYHRVLNTYDSKSLPSRTFNLENTGVYLVFISEGSTKYEFGVIIQENTGENASGNENTTLGFADVKDTDWFYESVQWAVSEEVTNGTSSTTFSPNQNCTVAQILTFLWRANGSPKATGSNPFTDVKSSDWFYDAALWAAEKGMVSGTLFNPNTPCTRSMAVTYIWKSMDSPTAKAASFTDVPASADYAQAVAWALEQGITTGTSATTFSPDTICTRGHIVTFLYRAISNNEA